MDGAEVNEKVRSIAVDADDAGEQEASSAVTENSRCSFESDDDRLKPKNVERAEKEEAARFLEETAQKALVTEEARSATVAEVSDFWALLLTDCVSLATLPKDLLFVHDEARWHTFATTVRHLRSMY